MALKRDEKKELNKQIIIQAAYDEMLTNGIQKTSVKRVSELSGISFVTMYKYFQNKDELAEAVAIKLFQDKSKILMDISKDSTIDFMTKFKKFSLTADNLRKEVSEPVLREFSSLFEQSPTVQKFISDWNTTFWKTMIKSGRETGFIQTNVSDDAIVVFASILSEAMRASKIDPKLLPQLEQLFIYGISGFGKD